MAQILEDFPCAREPVKYESGRVAANASLAVRPAHEEFGHSVGCPLISGWHNALTRDERKTDLLGALQNHQGMGLIVGKPVGEDLVLAGILSRTDHRKKSRY